MDSKIHARLGRLERSPGRPPQTSPRPISRHVRKNAITRSDVLAVLANEAGSEVLIAEDLPGKTTTAKTKTAKTATAKTATAKTATAKTATAKTATVPAMEGMKRVRRPNPKYLNE